MSAKKPTNLADDLSYQLHIQLRVALYDYVSYRLRSNIYNQLDAKISNQIAAELYWQFYYQLKKDLNK